MPRSKSPKRKNSKSPKRKGSKKRSKSPKSPKSSRSIAPKGYRTFVRVVDGESRGRYKIKKNQKPTTAAKRAYSKACGKAKTCPATVITVRDTTKGGKLHGKEYKIQAKKVNGKIKMGKQRKPSSYNKFMAKFVKNERRPNESHQMVFYRGAKAWRQRKKLRKAAGLSK